MLSAQLWAVNTMDVEIHTHSKKKGGGGEGGLVDQAFRLVLDGFD